MAFEQLISFPGQILSTGGKLVSAPQKMTEAVVNAAEILTNGLKYVGWGAAALIILFFINEDVRESVLDLISSARLAEINL